MLEIGQLGFDGNNFTAVSYFHAVANPMGTPGNLSHIGNPVGDYLAPRFPWQDSRYAQGQRSITRGSTQELLQSEALWRVTTTGTFTLQHISNHMHHITLTFSDGTSMRENLFLNEGARSTFQLGAHGGGTITFVRY